MASADVATHCDRHSRSVGMVAGEDALWGLWATTPQGLERQSILCFFIQFHGALDENSERRASAMAPRLMRPGCCLPCSVKILF